MKVKTAMCNNNIKTQHTNKLDNEVSKYTINSPVRQANRQTGHEQ